jgi:hypothetical protein
MERVMPIPFDQDIEAQLQQVLNRLRAKEDALNGPGAFDQPVRKGRILMSKRADELTAEEAAFLDAPPPAKRQ